ncbi:MAG: hypothetical protein ACOY0T_08270 [Myxococcota bacterium]
MRTQRSFITWTLGTLALVATASASPALSAGEKVRFALVVAKDSPVNDISFYDLKRLYKGEMVNVAGKRLVPLNLAPSTDNRVRFDQAVLGMNPESVSRYWIDRKIRGQSGPPKALEAADLVQRVVVRLDGGIGYVRVNEIKPDVKVVRIDGKTPKDGGYPVEF